MESETSSGTSHYYETELASTSSLLVTKKGKQQFRRWRSAGGPSDGAAKQEPERGPKRAASRGLLRPDWSYMYIRGGKWHVVFPVGDPGCSVVGKTELAGGGGR